MKIKICGIRSEDDIELINKYKPDFMGFIFYKKSKRYIDPEKALKLKSQLTIPIKTVGVFVDEDPDYILDCFHKGVFDLAQLHGQESLPECKRLQSEGLPVIKSLRIKDKNDFSQIGELDPDYFLFDVKSDKFVGGTGESFNWNLLDEFKKDTPYFLAGGIGLDNMKEAFLTNASVLDISSSIETDFKKDKDKVDKLFKLYRKLNV